MAIHLQPTNADAGVDYGESLAPGARAPAAYAASGVPSRGRMWPEPECPTRSPFQRDRDRVLHSTGFRRLTYKTQVFVFHEGDHFRTRLTHSLEVAQIARTIARQLRLDEDLAEVLALAHDLGHSPFGHAGERALQEVMRDFGGFDHNAQSLRVVTRLERKYMSFNGLNLTWETLEGLAKHNGPIEGPHGAAVLKVLRPLDAWRPIEPQRWASAEAQVAAIADDIAYVSHDIDDGLRAGLIRLGDLTGVPVAGPAAAAALAEGDECDEGRPIYEVNRRMITALIGDVIRETRVRLRHLRAHGPDDIRSSPRATVAFSDAMTQDVQALKGFLFERVYRHPRVMRVMKGAEQVVRDLFAHYREHPHHLPGPWASAAAQLTERKRARLIGDFVAGMTDRYAIAEHRSLFDATPDLR